MADVGLNNWIGVSRRLYGDGEMSFEKSLESSAKRLMSSSSSSSNAVTQEEG